MDVMVSARVPAQVRDRVADLLKEIDSNPTQLINAAYSYVLSTGKLPVADVAILPGRRTPTDQQRRELASSLSAITRKVPESFFQGRTDDQILEDELKADYESLS